jgi:hypothetical protein
MYTCIQKYIHICLSIYMYIYIYIYIGIWIFVALPLSVCGTIFGRHWVGKYEPPCRVNSIPRPIPLSPWYASPSFIIPVAGILPFGSIFIEVRKLHMLHICICMYTHIYVYIYVYINVYIYIYHTVQYIHINLYLHICTNYRCISYLPRFGHISSTMCTVSCSSCTLFWRW